MKNILVITTGGTIASEETAAGLAPARRGSDMIRGISDCKITILDLFSCDSTDISPEHWKKLYTAVKNGAVYDGIVILHGTDTLEYTAAMLYFTASYMGIPIIITGAMLPFSAPDSDGKRNIADAVKTACDPRFSGVYAVFCGRIIGGYEVVKCHSSHKDAFRSFSGQDCGAIDHGMITVNKYTQVPKPVKIPDEGGKTAVIKLTPFTEELHVPAGYTGAVIESFGAGGIPLRLEKHLKALCLRMPVVITTPCRGGADLTEYEVGQRALACGAIDGGIMSTACAAVKLWLG